MSTTVALVNKQICNIAILEIKVLPYCKKCGFCNDSTLF